MEREDSGDDFFYSHSPPVSLNIFIALWMALMAYNSFTYGTWVVWWLSASYAFLAFIAAIFRMGWFIPCTILGIMSGFFLLPIIGGSVLVGGNELSQMMNVAVFVLCGTTLGVGSGLAIDSSLNTNTSEQSPSKEAEEWT